MSLVEDVEWIVVEALAKRIRPDTKKVTRDIINKVADVLEDESINQVTATWTATPRWLRSQAQENNDVG